MIKFIYSLFISIILVGCENANNDNQNVKLPDDVAAGVIVHADQSEGTIRFNATADWTATTNTGGDRWFSFAPDNGKAGEQVIKVSFSPNYSGADRSFELNIHCNGSTATIVVTQKLTTEQGDDNSIAVIPDEAFKAYLLANFDVNQDGKMQVDEMWSIREIYIYDPNIKSIKGIEYCNVLYQVNVQQSGITLFDFTDASETLSALRLESPNSKNIKIVSPHVSHLSLNNIPSDVQLDLSQCEGITRLELYKASFDLVDLSKYPDLTSLTLQELPSAIASLDLSQFAQLEGFSVIDNTIQSLVICNPELRSVFLQNIKIPSIDLSQCENLENLFLAGKCETSYLNLGNFTPELTNDQTVPTFEISNDAEDFTLISHNVKKLIAKGTMTKKLNLEGCKSLGELTLGEYSFEGEYPNQTVIEGTIAVKALLSLTSVSLGGSAYNVLDISACPAVMTLHIEGLSALSFKLIPSESLASVEIRDSNNEKHAPRTIDLSNCAALEGFSCYWMTGLKELNLSGCVSLESASVTVGGEMNLSKLNFDGCTSLTTINCPANGIEELGLDRCTKLSQLKCSGNKLTTLDVSHCNIFNDVYIYPDFYPLQCNMPTLTTLYLKTGWQINGINKFRKEEYIKPSTNILYK